MKKIIIKNVILIVIFLISPWFIYENFYVPGMPDIYVNSLIYFMFFGAVFLLYNNISSVIKSKGSRRTASILFIVPPFLIILYFVLGYLAFSGFTGF